MIHVLVFELRRLLGSFVIGTLSVVGILVLFVGGAYPIYRDAKAEVEPILASMPPQFATVFGIGQGVDIFTFAGFYRFSYLYIALAAAIAGIAWGLAAFAREKRSKAVDFLYTMPVSRPCVFAAKLLACLIYTVLLGAIYVVSVLATAAFVDGRSAADAVIPASHLAVAAIAVPAVTLMFAGFGALLAATMRRVRSVSGIATSAGLLGFITVSLPELTGEDKWRIIAPFLYFNQDKALVDGQYEAGWIAVAIAVTVACFAAAFAVSVRAEVKAQ